MGARERRRVPTEGHVTSSTYSPHLGIHIGLALVVNGGRRLGERLHAVSPLAGEGAAVEIVERVLVDPDGTRARD